MGLGNGSKCFCFVFFLVMSRDFSGLIPSVFIYINGLPGGVSCGVFLVLGGLGR